MPDLGLILQQFGGFEFWKGQRWLPGLSLSAPSASSSDGFALRGYFPAAPSNCPFPSPSTWLYLGFRTDTNCSFGPAGGETLPAQLPPHAGAEPLNVNSAVLGCAAPSRRCCQQDLWLLAASRGSGCGSMDSSGQCHRLVPPWLCSCQRGDFPGTLQHPETQKAPGAGNGKEHLLWKDGSGRWRERPTCCRVPCGSFSLSPIRSGSTRVG